MLISFVLFSFRLPTEPPSRSPNAALAEFERFPWLPGNKRSSNYRLPQLFYPFTKNDLDVDLRNQRNSTQESVSVRVFVWPAKGQPRQKLPCQTQTKYISLPRQNTTFQSMTQFLLTNHDKNITTSLICLTCLSYAVWCGQCFLNDIKKCKCAGNDPPRYTAWKVRTENDCKWHPRFVGTLMLIFCGWSKNFVGTVG